MRGVCWSQSQNPTISDGKTEDGGGGGSYSSGITGLTPNTTYYIRAYATNSEGTGYGTEMVFKTYTDTVTDVDLNVYNTVTIGTQIWMAENLKTTKYNNNSAIPLVTGNSAWTNLTTPGYCWYDNNISNKTTYGALYNWYTANTGNLCPTGWHVPGDDEWSTLTNYLGGEAVAGGKLKETGATHWLTLNTDATNESGFTAIPGGMRSYGGLFDMIGYLTSFWSSTESSVDNAWYRLLISKSNQSKKEGYSVRCIKDQINTIAIIVLNTTSASGGGNILNDGGSAVTQRGVCWSTSHNPTISDSHTDDGEGTGSYSSSITGLTANTTYYVRAYATNSLETFYGEELVFKTYTGTVTDVDLNVYNTVTIGTQIWMAENLKTTKYRNNDLIGTTDPVTKDITGESTPKYQWAYNGDEDNADIYGRLYTWYAITDSRNVCPTGWHVPSDAEWTTMENYLVANGYNNDGTTSDYKIAKSLTTSFGWTLSTSSGTVGNADYPAKRNATSFSALPGGYSYIDGTFSYAGSNGFWWSSTEEGTVDSWFRALAYNGNLMGNTFDNKRHGISVRCVKD